jgi:hypothetical protein
MISKSAIKKIFFLTMVFCLFCNSACFRAAKSKLEKGVSNPLLNLWVPWSKPGVRAYNHSIIRSFRGKSDCQPNCPTANIWQYQYKNAKTKKIVTSKHPIASKKEHWKVPFEARIVAVTLFGDNHKFLNGLELFIKSNKSLKKFNGIPEHELWGYETFTFRVYTPKRSPFSKKKTHLKGELPETFIQKLLAMGCEVVFVDNNLDAVGVDAFFWRFMIAAEKMKPTERIRYMIRDADWIITAAEAFMVGEWINSGLEFHRPQLLPACMGPLFGGLWAGHHTGKGRFSSLKDYIEKYPYHNYYGDDEMFLRDIVWPKVLDAGSLLTHYFKEDFFYHVSVPYQGSCQRPTQQFCDEMKIGGICRDEVVPVVFSYPYMTFGTMENNQIFLEKKIIFDMHLQKNERSKEAAKGLSLNPFSKF